MNYLNRVRNYKKINKIEMIDNKYEDINERYEARKSTTL